MNNPEVILMVAGGTDAVVLSDLVELAGDIDAAHGQAELHAVSAVQHAITAGRLRNEAKDRVQRGIWIEWLKHNCVVAALTEPERLIAEHADADLQGGRT